MANDKLKPCPFCNSENVHICKENKEFVVECKDCGACGSFLMSLQQARNRWNLAKRENKSNGE
jgi:transcription elongation factor Elf1